ncbi:YadA-like family protein [Vibrio gigantis]|uniref:YadA C-terminal domain-containing protein n=1 Tax=Vibrio gigantis TaxID=296199 RepID=UPI003D0CE51F
MKFVKTLLAASIAATSFGAMASDAAQSPINPENKTAAYISNHGNGFTITGSNGHNAMYMEYDKDSGGYKASVNGQDVDLELSDNGLVFSGENYNVKVSEHGDVLLNGDYVGNVTIDGNEIKVTDRIPAFPTPEVTPPPAQGPIAPPTDNTPPDNELDPEFGVPLPPVDGGPEKPGAPERPDWNPDHGTVDMIHDAVDQARDQYQQDQNRQAARDTIQDRRIASNTNRIDNLEAEMRNMGDKMLELDDRMDGVVASSHAIMNARPALNSVGDFGVGVGMGFAGSKEAIALGGAYAFNENWSASASLNYETSGNFSDSQVSGGAGVQYTFK